VEISRLPEKNVPKMQFFFLWGRKVKGNVLEEEEDPFVVLMVSEIYGMS